MHIDIYKDIYTKRNILLTVTYNSHFSMLFFKFDKQIQGKKGHSKNSFGVKLSSEC